MFKRERGKKGTGWRNGEKKRKQGAQERQKEDHKQKKEVRRGQDDRRDTGLFEFAQPVEFTGVRTRGRDQRRSEAQAEIVGVQVSHR